MKRVLMLSTAMAAVLLSAGQVSAQTTSSSSSSGTPSSTETVIVTGTKAPEEAIPMKTTFTQGNISTEDILNASPAPGMTIQTLLNTQPSIYAVAGGPNGVNTNIKFRNFDDGEFGETIEGVPMNDLFNSGVTGEASVTNNNLFVLRDLESVQVYRGVNNPSVNTYDSLGGTVNFLPRQPKDEMGGDVGVDGGSFGGFGWHATFDTGNLYGLEQTVSISRDFSSGWIQNTPDQNDNLYYANKADLDSRTEFFTTFVYNHNEGQFAYDLPVDLIKANGWDFNWSPTINAISDNDTDYLGIVGIKSHITDTLTVENEAYGGDDNFHRVGFSNYQYTGPYWLPFDGEKSWYLSNLASAFTEPAYGGQAYGNKLTSKTTKYAYAATDYHDYGYTTALYGDRTQVVWDLPFNTITAGGDFNVGELHSREYLYGSYYMPNIDGYNDWWDEHDTRQMWSAYFQDDIHFLDDRIHITPGLKYIQAVSKDNDALGYYYDPPGSIRDDNHFLSPTIGASFEPFPDFSVYGSFGKNVKFPSIDALYNELGYSTNNPLPTVQPEYALDYEMGVRYKLDNLTTEVNVYRENFSHIIYSETLSDGASFYLNGGSERYQGVEFQLNDDIGEWWIGSWKTYVSASYNEAVCTSTTTNDQTDSSCYAGEELNNVPTYLTSLGVTWDYDAWHVDLKAQYVGSQHLENYSSGLPEQPSQLAPGEPTEIPGYFLMNVGVVKVIPIEGLGPVNNLRLALHVDNLLDRHYYTDMYAHYTDNTNGDSTYGSVGEPRAVYGSVSIYF